MDSDDDETCNFEAYAFQFNNNGTVTATSISDTEMGLGPLLPAGTI